MQKRIVNWLRSNSLLIALAFTIVITILSLVKGEDIPLNTLVKDKIIHFSAYFILMMVWLFANENIKTPFEKWKVFLILVLFGIIIELLQGYLTNYRSMDWKDALANALGLLIGSLLYYVTREKNFKKNNQYLK